MNRRLKKTIKKLKESQEKTQELLDNLKIRAVILQIKLDYIKKHLEDKKGE